MSVNHLQIHKIDDGAGFHVRCACGVEAMLVPNIVGGTFLTARQQLATFERKHFACRAQAKTAPSPETLDLGPAALPAGGA